MSVCIGIGVAADSVRVVVLSRNGEVRWHAETPRESTGMEPLGAALRAAMAALPKRRWPRPQVSIALGPHCTQLRLLSELPPLGRAAVSRAVGEGTNRFFLRNGVPLVTGGVRLIDDRSAWAAAFEMPVVETVIACCREARLQLVAIVPTAAVLHVGLPEANLVWDDGDVRAHIAYEGSRVTAFTRVSTTASTASPAAGLTPHDRLAALGAGGWRFADAFGAAAAGVREPLRLRSTALKARKSRAPAWRHRISIAASVTALAMAAAAPGASAWRTEQLAESELRARTAEQQRVANTARELDRVTGVLAEGAAFVRHRRSHLTLLASLATALSADAWITAIKTDSAGGHLVTFAGRAAGVLAAMDSVSGIGGAELLGPVTREVVGAREVERATFRFRWDDSDCVLRAAHCGPGPEARQ
jgi:hypothetical protein